MNDIFMFLMLASFISLVTGLVKPLVFQRLFKNKATRRKLSLYFGSATILFFILFGATTNPTNKTTIDSITKKTDSKSIIETQTKEIQLTPEEQAKKMAEEKVLQEKLSKPHFEDGDYMVGTDIQPGIYRTRTASIGCYYSRLRGFGGGISDIISNENTNAPTIVTIATTDKGFSSKHCGTWIQDLSAITTNQTTFEDGTFIVNTDILPGTYKSSGDVGCYYSRLRGFSGGVSDIISNENTDTPAIVTISKSDKGFRATRCGVWTKIK